MDTDVVDITVILFIENMRGFVIYCVHDGMRDWEKEAVRGE